MLGYGETDKPYDPEEYSLRRISDDLASILDVIRVRKVVSPRSGCEIHEPSNLPGE